MEQGILQGIPRHRQKLPVGPASYRSLHVASKVWLKSLYRNESQSLRGSSPYDQCKASHSTATLSPTSLTSFSLFPITFPLLSLLGSYTQKGNREVLKVPDCGVKTVNAEAADPGLCPKFLRHTSLF